MNQVYSCILDVKCLSFSQEISANATNQNIRFKDVQIM